MFINLPGKGKPVYESPRVERPSVPPQEVLVPRDILAPPKDEFRTPKAVDGLAAALGGPALIGVTADIMTGGNLLTTPAEANAALAAIALSLSIKASVEAGVWVANRSREAMQRVGRHVAFVLHGDPEGGPVENGVQTTRFTLDSQTGQFVNTSYLSEVIPEVSQAVELGPPSAPASR